MSVMPRPERSSDSTDSVKSSPPRHRTRALHDAVAEYAAAGQRFLQVFENIVRDLHALNGERRERRRRREDGKIGDRIPVEIQRAKRKSEASGEASAMALSERMSVRSSVES